jgi:hypothetical protein
MGIFAIPVGTAISNVAKSTPYITTLVVDSHLSLSGNEKNSS